MSLIDEHTKAKLDDGEVVILDGGYFVIGPETLMQTVRDSVLEIMGSITMEQAPEEEANEDFMEPGFRCSFCGKRNDSMEYTLKNTGGYSSAHDTESRTLEICEGCLERMIAAVSEE